MRTPIALTTLLALLLVGCTADSTTDENTRVVNAASVEDSTSITVYKSPSCGCCSLWVDHLEENGFTVQTVEMDNLSSVREYYGLPREMAACHTAVVDGYVVEGHVPADDVYRLLEERPEAIGIAVPGMPIGSPGMEVEGRPADKYDVFLVDGEGWRVFASH